MEQIWKRTYEDRRAQWKLKASEKPEPSPSPGNSKKSNYRSGIREGINQNSQARLHWEAGIRSDVSGSDQTLDVNIDAFISCYEPALNIEQERAFRIAAGHSLTPNGLPLRMYLGGPGGTGKSHVINALKSFFEARKQARRFCMCSYTGIASRNITGMTLHSALCLGQ
ncbi:hypothetical protein K435DRAFT_685984, partial [Dendrothele bispora CBS 962.96]